MSDAKRPFLINKILELEKINTHTKIFAWLFFPTTYLWEINCVFTLKKTDIN